MPAVALKSRLDRRLTGEIIIAERVEVGAGLAYLTEHKRQLSTFSTEGKSSFIMT